MPQARAWAKEFARALSQFFFPPLCLGCETRLEESRELVCPHCLADLREVPSPFCTRCGIPRAGRPVTSRCAACTQLHPAVTVVRAAVLLEGQAECLVRRFKYQGWSELAPLFGRRMVAAALVQRLFPGVECLAPVPLHPARLRERGFNQSALLANELSQASGIPLESLLIRRKNTSSQTGLDARARRKNVREAFGLAPAPASPLAGACVLLVDDVLTTGATVSACAETLVGAGVREVRVLTFARAT